MSGHRRRAESSGHYDRLVEPIRRTTTGAIDYDYYAAHAGRYAELKALDERTFKNIGLKPHSEALAIASGLWEPRPHAHCRDAAEVPAGMGRLDEDKAAA